MKVLDVTMPTILLVDDAPAVLSVLERALNLLFPSYQVVAVADADQALIALNTYSAVVMITDLLMPGMDGQVLSSMVRRLHPSIYIILATAHIDPTLNQAPIDACLHKPFPLNQLELLVQKGIEQNQTLQERMVAA